MVVVANAAGAASWLAACTHALAAYSGITAMLLSP